MPEFHSSTSVPSLTAIERPRCPNCRTRMSLARIAPGPSTYDLRTFECPKCNCVHKAFVAADPMKSDATGWLVGDLKPPT